MDEKTLLFAYFTGKRWSISCMLNGMDATRINEELSRLLTLQVEFFQKTPAEHTWAEYDEFVRSRDRVRELFVELERLRKEAYGKLLDEYLLSDRTGTK